MPYCCHKMTSSTGNIFRVTLPLYLHNIHIALLLVNKMCICMADRGWDISDTLVCLLVPGKTYCYHQDPCNNDLVSKLHLFRYSCGQWGFTVTGEFPSHRPVTRSFDVFFIWAWINGWVNNRQAGELRHQRAHYDVTVRKYITRGLFKSSCSHMSRIYIRLGVAFQFIFLDINHTFALPNQSIRSCIRK